MSFNLRSQFSTFFLGSTLAFTLGCSSGEPRNFSCEDELGDACGASCSAEESCPSGLYCEASSCKADCKTSDDCSAGGTCTAEGRCEGGDTSNTSGSNDINVDGSKSTDPTMSTGKEGETCAEAKVEFESTLPQVWFLTDQSGSMTRSLTNDNEVTAPPYERWDALGNVLFGDGTTDRGVIGRYESEVSFGITFFREFGFGECGPLFKSVDLALNNYAPIQTLYKELTPNGGTPTAGAMKAATETAVKTPASTGPKIIILTTDGEPTLCDKEMTPELKLQAKADTEAEVKAAFDQFILTFVVFIGPDLGTLNRTHLQTMANYGVGKEKADASPEEYYTVESEEKLSEAFGAIVGNARGCTFALEGEVDPGGASSGTVLLNDTALTLNDPDGWKLKSENEVELVGASCSAIKDGKTNLDIKFPCDVYTPPIVK